MKPFLYAKFDGSVIKNGLGKVDNLFNREKRFQVTVYMGLSGLPPLYTEIIEWAAVMPA